MKSFKKIISIFLLQVFLITNHAFAGFVFEGYSVWDENCLAPQLVLSTEGLKSLVSSFLAEEKPRLFTVHKGQLYNISNADFIQGYYSGFWPVEQPLMDIAQSCTLAVFTDKHGKTFLCHIDAGKNEDIDFRLFENEWSSYPALDQTGEIVPAFDKNNIFHPETKVLIFNRDKDSIIPEKLGQFLNRSGIKKYNIITAAVPEKNKTDTIGLFFWPKDRILEASYASFNGKGYGILEVQKYDLDDLSLSPKTFEYARPADEQEKNEFDLHKIEDSIFYNRLINRFFMLSEQNSFRQTPWSLIVHDIFNLKEDFISEVIMNAETKGRGWIIQQAEDLRETHSSRSSYQNPDTGGSWASFIEKTGDDVYNLAHLLAHTLGLVTGYAEAGMPDKASEYFEQGYIILRAISFESEQIENKSRAKIHRDFLSSPLLDGFFRRNNIRQTDENSLPARIKSLLTADYPLIKKIILDIEDQGEVFIAKEGWRVLNEFFNETSYSDFKKSASWHEFLGNKASSPYSLKQVLAHLIGSADLAMQRLRRLSSDHQEYESVRGLFKDQFSKAYLILRAIEIEGKDQDPGTAKKQERTGSNLSEVLFLPDVEIEQIDPDEALIIAEKLSENFKQNSISFLGYDSTDENPGKELIDADPKQAFSVKALEDIEVVFLGQDPEIVYKRLEVMPGPDTYYICVVQGHEIIGYGALDYGIFPDEDIVAISFRIYDEYRHRQFKVSRQVYKTILSASRQIFGTQINRFFIPVHQISGREGISSGAVVFYLRMGFKLKNQALQAMWENDYSKQVRSGKTLPDHVIKLLANCGMELDLNKTGLVRPEIDIYQKRLDIISPEPIEQAI